MKEVTAVLENFFFKSFMKKSVSRECTVSVTKASSNLEINKTYAKCYIVSLLILSLCFTCVCSSCFHSAFELNDKNSRAKKQYVMQVYMFIVQ